MKLRVKAVRLTDGRLAEVYSPVEAIRLSDGRIVEDQFAYNEQLKLVLGSYKGRTREAIIRLLSILSLSQKVEWKGREGVERENIEGHRCEDGKGLDYYRAIECSDGKLFVSPRRALGHQWFLLATNTEQSAAADILMRILIIGDINEGNDTTRPTWLSG